MSNRTSKKVAKHHKPEQKNFNKSMVIDNLDEEGQTGNIHQNLTHQPGRQDR
ncbi:MAG: hypothetical protein U1E36_01370 [Rickettsiales bacterium]